MLNYLGTGKKRAYRVAAQLREERSLVPFLHLLRTEILASRLAYLLADSYNQLEQVEAGLDSLFARFADAFERDGKYEETESFSDTRYSDKTGAILKLASLLDFHFSPVYDGAYSTHAPTFRLSLGRKPHLSFDPIPWIEPNPPLTSLDDLMKLTSLLGLELALPESRATKNQPALESAGQVLIAAHCDVHGLIMLGITMRYLKLLGIQATPLLSYEETGDVHKFWKRILPKLAPSYDWIITLDIPVDSRYPGTAESALNSCSETSEGLIIIDHHIDTLKRLAVFGLPNLTVQLTDAENCYFGVPLKRDLFWTQLASVVERDLPALYSTYDDRAELIIRILESEFSKWTPTPKELKRERQNPLIPLINSVIEEQIGNDAASAENSNLPESSHVDSAMGTLSVKAYSGLLRVTNRLTLPGRSWYRLLEELIEQEGTLDGRINTPYAVATRTLIPGQCNSLFLTHWRAVWAPPIAALLPDEYSEKWVGHPRAFWLDVPEAEFEPLLDRIVQNIISVLTPKRR